MSGWDEGAVFYSDQAQFPRGGPGGDPAADLSRHSALRKFKEFLRGFTGPTGDFPYRESLVHNRDHVTVAIEDLDAFDAELSDKIRKSPADYLPLVRCFLRNFVSCVDLGAVSDSHMGPYSLRRLQPRSSQASVRRSPARPGRWRSPSPEMSRSSSPPRRIACP
jgi:hypothetical protein